MPAIPANSNHSAKQWRYPTNESTLYLAITAKFFTHFALHFVIRNFNSRALIFIMFWSDISHYSRVVPSLMTSHEWTHQYLAFKFLPFSKAIFSTHFEQFFVVRKYISGVLIFKIHGNWYWPLFTAGAKLERRFTNESTYIQPLNSSHFTQQYFLHTLNYILSSVN